MSRITPVDWRTLERVFQADGWSFLRQKGSHRIYTKLGCLRPVVIPAYDEISAELIHSNLRTAQMSRERYLELLARR